MANTQDIKKIGIIGRGAIGVNIAFNLQFVENIQTTLLVREHYNLSETPSLLTVDGKTHSIQCDQAYISDCSLQPLDLLILPVKQYQIEPLLRTIAEHLYANTTVLLLHNGMGGIELMQQYLPSNSLLVATTTDGVYRTSTADFIQTAVGQFDIGTIYQETLDEEKKIQKLKDSTWNYLHYLHPNLLWRNDMEFALYQKLAVNAAINPLTALKNCKNGDLVYYVDEIKKVKEEIFDLYEFMNLPIDNHALSLHIDDVIQLTKENYSSMHQDFQNERETEVEGILGFLLEKGKETGMKMTFIQILYEQIKAQSTSYKKT